MISDKIHLPYLLIRNEFDTTDTDLSAMAAPETFEDLSPACAFLF